MNVKEECSVKRGVHVRPNTVIELLRKQGALLKPDCCLHMISIVPNIRCSEASPSSLPTSTASKTQFQELTLMKITSLVLNWRMSIYEVKTETGIGPMVMPTSALFRLPEWTI